MAIKKVRRVKFTDSYDNSTLLKSDNNKDPKSLITYVEPKHNLNTKGEGQIACYSI